MFGLGPVEIAAIVVVGCLLEILLLWTATGLADAPEAGWGRLAGVGLGVFLLCFAAAAGIAAALGVLQQPTLPDNRTPAVAAAAFSLTVALVLPGLIYPAVLPVSLRRGLWVSVLQWLLRLFLYVLLTGVGMVVAAVAQIARGS